MSSTGRLGLPYIVTSQAQKEVTHNDGLNRLDAFVTPIVADIADAPPGSPAVGDLYIVGTSPSGDFTDHANELTQYHTGIKWVDALNGTVRPVIAYSFFILYAVVKAMQFSADLPWLLWTAEDQAIFAGIISFYFGQRAMSKLRQGR